MKSRIILLSAVGLLLFVGVNARAQSGNLVGRLSASHDGCGCYFSFNRSDYKKSKLIFFASLDNDSDIWMGIDGRDVKLKLVSRVEPKGKERVGSRATEKYSAAGVTVTLVRTVTWVCPPRDESCEVTKYSAVFTVSKGKRKQVVRAVGECGC
ncbi:MAG: hypothetical protein ABIP75_09945 [Pyrinomonadaceae bacterium]